ncbi:hypothetical protein [Paraburkholderia bannensis]|uniref:hypothetical protein n=1 Tax=Paraburkholderia bannensis TaxID=765414 RepID=UPI002AB63845|nr:hypothetical protein [Paraburkholderia bannensis]
MTLLLFAQAHFEAILLCQRRIKDIDLGVILPLALATFTARFFSWTIARRNRLIAWVESASLGYDASAAGSREVS